MLFTYYIYKNTSSLKTDALSLSSCKRKKFQNMTLAYGFPSVIENSLNFIWFCFIFYNYWSVTKSRHLIIQVFSMNTRYLYRPAVIRRENFIVNWLIKKWTLNLLISKLTYHCWYQHYKERFQNSFQSKGQNSLHSVLEKEKQSAS